MRSITSKHGVRLMLICVLFDGSAGMLIKLLPWNPFVIAGLRGALASALLFLYYKNRGIKIVVNRRSILAGAMISAMFITFISATRMTTAANAIALQFTNPVFIILFLFLIFRQKPKARELLSVLGVFAGVILIFSGSVSAAGLPGNILGVVSGAALAGMLLFNNRVKDPGEHFGALILGHVVTFIISVWFIISDPPVINTTTTLAILALGVLQQMVPNILYAYAIRVVKPLVCSLIMMLQLVVNPALVFIMVGEIPGVAEAAGCALILLVSAAAVVTDAKARRGKIDSATNVCHPE